MDSDNESNAQIFLLAHMNCGWCTLTMLFCRVHWEINGNIRYSIQFLRFWVFDVDSEIHDAHVEKLQWRYGMFSYLWHDWVVIGKRSRAFSVFDDCWTRVSAHHKNPEHHQMQSTTWIGIFFEQSAPLMPTHACVQQIQLIAIKYRTLLMLNKEELKSTTSLYYPPKAPSKSIHSSTKTPRPNSTTKLSTLTQLAPLQR